MAESTVPNSCLLRPQDSNLGPRPPAGGPLRKEALSPTNEKPVIAAASNFFFFFPNKLKYVTLAD